MNITHVIEYFNPLLSYQENKLAQLQLKDGHQVSIVTSNKYTPWGSRLDKETLQKFKEGDAKYLAMGCQIFRLRSLLDIRRRNWLPDLAYVIRKLRSDFLICHGFASTSTLRLLWYKRTGKLNVPVMADDHMVKLSKSLPKVIYILPQKLGLARLIETAERLVAVSEDTKQYAIDRYGIRKQIRVIPLGVDLEVFSYRENQRVRLRKQLGLASEDILIVYAGKINVEKDPILLLKAFKKLQANHQKHTVKLLLIGNVFKNYERQFFELLNTVPNAFHQPQVTSEELANYYSAADLAVWPKGSSLSMLEAMACKTPVVAPDLIVNRERLASGAGIVFIEGNENDLLEKLVRFVNNDYNRHQMAEEGMYYANKHSWESIHKAFMGEGLRAIELFNKQF